jgi:hypothetical protein
MCTLIPLGKKEYSTYDRVEKDRQAKWGYGSLQKGKGESSKVTYTCNPSYLGGWDQKDHSLRQAWANSSQDPHLQNNQSKMDWRCGSSSRVPALQAKFHQKKKKKKVREKRYACMLCEPSF